MNEIAFTKIDRPYGWLGNMSRYTIGIWPTLEHAFQAQRFADTHPVRALIADTKSPMTAKLLAKKCAQDMKITPRSPEDVDLMLKLLRFKLEQHPILREKLNATGTVTIIEDVSKRPDESGLFWGAARTGDGWRGQNVLGKLWMRLRDDPAGPMRG